MPEAGTTVVERSVAEMVARPETPERTNTVVTQDNFNDWVDEKLGVAPTPAGEDGPVGGNGSDTLVGATAEPEKTSATEPKEFDTRENGKKSEVYFRGKWVGKHDFDYRLHVKTEEKTKAEQDARKAAEAKAKTEQERADAAERQANELRTKYEPPRTDELGPEPQPAQFKDVAEYSKAIKDWTAESTRREENAKRQSEEATRNWNQRKEAARKEIQDFDAVIEGGKDVKLSGPLTEAVVDSEIGPKLLHHFAKPENAELVDALNKMPIGRMLKEVGKLEISLSSKEPAKPAPEPAKTTVAEVSRAPAPITPIKGAAAGVVSLKGSDQVPSNMTYEDWKAARIAGRIK